MATRYPEVVVAGWLEDQTGVAAYATVPDERPSELYVVAREGGSSSPGVDRPLLSVQAWAKTRSRAAELAEAARRGLSERLAPSVRGVQSARVSTTYWFPDPESGLPRYQLSLQLVTTFNS